MGGVADVHNSAYAMLCHRAQQRIAVLVKAWVIIVRVGIKNILHKGTSLQVMVKD